MQRRSWAAIGGVVLSLVLGSTADAAYTPGARSLGDTLFPALGNGGYDVQHYDLTLGYDPAANAMVASADITQRATQDLSEFTLDFRGMTVTGVTIDGAAATFTREADKLVIRPAAGIDANRVFRTVVAYHGVPVEIQDPDESLEGWLRTSDGAFVVNEPMGAMSWFPNNDHPLDKATFDFHITVPSTHTALGNGELVGPFPPVPNGDGTTTWNWHDGYPTATYLTTATIGVFDLTRATSATATGASGAALQLYNAWDSAFSPDEKTGLDEAAADADAIVSYLADSIGVAYPFESIGAVADRLPTALGYVLEVQTKIHFPGAPISLTTLAHETAHEWFGNSVSLEQWGDIWLNEGWATWWEWNWSSRFNDGATPAALFTSNYNSPSNPSRWDIPTANLPDASHLFNPAFPVYTRGAMALEGLRQIIGDGPFEALQQAWQSERRYGNGSSADFVALAERIARERSGFDASNLAKLDEYFQQWLYTPGKPTLTPAAFFASTTVPGASAGGTVPATLSLSLAAPAGLGPFTPGAGRSYTASTSANVTSTAGDAAFSVSDPSTVAPGRLVNGGFALAQPLQVKATDDAAPASAFAPLGAAPLTLLTYPGPISNDPVRIDFLQAIGADEPLRTGSYTKTLTFALSTTAP